ncbi:hypothetical protein, partial [Escherichia coli]|uniref:hypothetical protein n=1 Tax=Escherichia coli TaxID=562 RepID=UPI001412878E
EASVADNAGEKAEANLADNVEENIATDSLNSVLKSEDENSKALCQNIDDKRLADSKETHEENNISNRDTRILVNTESLEKDEGLSEINLV